MSEDTKKAPATEPDKRKTTAAKAAKEAAEAFVYIGPSRRETKLTEGRIMTGTRAEVLDHFAEEVRQVPEVEKLIVPVAELSAARAQVRAGGNLLSHLYEKVKAAAFSVAATAKEEV
ncbi:MAG: hypothetical protein FWE08_06170 [Oscillospiraceae bacterium]|nr:hypothetical protein [Oscillospiraceae bacterium]